MYTMCACVCVCVCVCVLLCMFAGEVHKVITENNKLLKAQIPALRRSLTLYLANEETEHILFRPCSLAGWVLIRVCSQTALYTHTQSQVHVYNKCTSHPSHSEVTQTHTPRHSLIPRLSPLMRIFFVIAANKS